MPALYAELPGWAEPGHYRQNKRYLIPGDSACNSLGPEDMLDPARARPIIDKIDATPGSAGLGDFIEGYR